MLRPEASSTRPVRAGLAIPPGPQASYSFARTARHGVERARAYRDVDGSADDAGPGEVRVCERELAEDRAARCIACGQEAGEVVRVEHAVRDCDGTEVERAGVRRSPTLAPVAADGPDLAVEREIRQLQVRLRAEVDRR